MKKPLGIAALVLILLIGAGAFVGYRLLVGGVGGLDDWVVRRVVGIAEVYLVPNVEFDSFAYDKGAVTLRGVRLIAPDGTAVVEAEALRVAFAGIPTPASGVVIESVELDGASLHLIRAGAGGFKGLIPFVKRENVRRQDQVQEDMRLGTAFQIRHIVLKDCSVVYDEGEGQPPMQLGGIELDMNVEPDPDAANDRVYTIKTELDRVPILSLAVNGRLNLDALALDLDALTLKADLAEEQAVAALPPQIQALLREHEVSGRIELDATGEIPLGAPLDSSLSASAALHGFNVATGDYRLPIDSGLVKVDYSSRIANLGTAQLQLCQGVVDAGGSQINLTGAATKAGVRWSVSGFHLRDLLRANTTDGSQPPKIAGVVASSGTADVASATPLSVSGSGELTVREGRLVNLPLISGLARAMNVLGKITGAPKFNDKADAAFTLTDTGVEVESLSAETEILAAHGNGTIGYDGTLDLLLNAGPMEKLQNAAGIIGDIVGAVTDQVVKYDVEGTVGAPTISVRPLGIGG